VGHPNVRLREQEDIVPEASLEIVLHLGEIEVRPGAAFDELLCVVIKVEGKIKERARHGDIVDCHSRFVQVPTSGAGQNEVYLNVCKRVWEYKAKPTGQ